MAESPEEFYARATVAAGPDGRLAPSQITRWDIFPFEQVGLRVVRLEEPVVPEPARHGERGTPCTLCTGESASVWENERWRLGVTDEPSGAPLVLVLVPRSHHDLTTLPDALAAEMGVLVSAVARAVESLPHVARAHVAKWGDGAEHLHLFFYARPEGFAQLRGTCLAVWDDLLPPTPRAGRDGDARAVADALVDLVGGRRTDSSPGEILPTD